MVSTIIVQLILPDTSSSISASKLSSISLQDRFHPNTSLSQYSSLPFPTHYHNQLSPLPTTTHRHDQRNTIHHACSAIYHCAFYSPQLQPPNSYPLHPVRNLDPYKYFASILARIHPRAHSQQEEEERKREKNLPSTTAPIINKSQHQNESFDRSARCDLLHTKVEKSVFDPLSNPRPHIPSPDQSRSNPSPIPTESIFQHQTPSSIYPYPYPPPLAINASRPYPHQVESKNHTHSRSCHIPIPILSHKKSHPQPPT